jgi:NhaA family Na+:H+ antiporter
VVKKIRPTIFQRFFRTETVGGSILLLFGVAALVLANSPLAEAYERLWQIPLRLGIVDHLPFMSLHGWFNDGLMAVFFLPIGLEIKRELLVGELASISKAALPIACAIGGMIVPAVFYWIFNSQRIWSAGLGYSHRDRYCLCARSAGIDRAGRADRCESIFDRTGDR